VTLVIPVRKKLQRFWNRVNQSKENCEFLSQDFLTTMFKCILVLSHFKALQ